MNQMNPVSTQGSASATLNDPTIVKVRDNIRKLIYGTALHAGWSQPQATLMAVKGEESATSRIAMEKSPAPEAIGEAIGDAELIVALDVFSKALQDSGDANQAFGVVADIKRKATAELPEAEVISQAAEAEFKGALAAGLSPCAALASAFTTAAAMARLTSLQGK